MSKRKSIDEIAGETSATPDCAPATALNSELPFFQSPSVSPANSEPAETTTADAVTPDVAIVSPAAQAPEIQDTEVQVPDTSAGALSASVLERVQTAFARVPRFAWRPRHKRYAILAASVVIAAAIGAVAGIAATGGFSKADVSIAVEENKAAQQSIARLSKEISTLKASLDAANKSAHVQFAKLSDRLNRESSEITNSIAPPRTTQTQASAPLPAPRPLPAAGPARPTVITDWSIREMHDGYVYVQGHGDIYQVVPGAPLPGLGPIEQIKRQDGRWVVVTPKGIIVSMRDRRYFEQF